jgi:hypothetical protein
MRYISDKGFVVIYCFATKGDIITTYGLLKEGEVLVIPFTNSKTYEQSLRNNIYKFIYQIDGPPKFTYENDTFIRKDGELKITDGVIEWQGFDTFREVILHLITWEEAIKIIDTWK